MKEISYKIPVNINGIFHAVTVDPKINLDEWDYMRHSVKENGDELEISVFVSNDKVNWYKVNK